MSDGVLTEGIAAHRLSEAEVKANFADIHPSLSGHEAAVAADRCYFCHDAPCVTACPTEIDIPLFIRQIAGGNPLGAARTIFEQNIFGGMCARVCPTETLCEQACVREAAEDKSVLIGLLQRYATDAAMGGNVQFFERAPATGQSVAIIGAGPAGLACAHGLALAGHEVTVFESRPKPGGLNEYGIAAYKTVDDFAAREVEYITALGGIEIRYGQPVGSKLTIEKLQADHDAVFLACGLAGVNALGLKGAPRAGVEDAVAFIARVRQAGDLTTVPVGRRVVVIGGGMTAIDAAVQAKLLGAEEVTICYRRGPDAMNASPYERDLAAVNGVLIRHWLQPVTFRKSAGKLKALDLEYTSEQDGKLAGTGNKLSLPADQVLVAIGQTLDDGPLQLARNALALKKGRIAVDADGRTTVDGIWAGGDCCNRGDDLTVTAVAQGRDAAKSINAALAG